MRSLNQLTDEEKVAIGEKGAEDLLGTCGGAYEATYCPDDLAVDDFLILVEDYGSVAQCNCCGWYHDISEFDDDGDCEDCQADKESEEE